MTFKEEVQAKVLATTLAFVLDPQKYELGSIQRSLDLAENILEELEFENPEDDTAIHNATVEVLKIYAQERLDEDDGTTSGDAQADFALVKELLDLLYERNQQIYLNDILGG